jgi:hypothetical protein
MTRHKMIPVMTFGRVVRSRRCRQLDCDASCAAQMLRWFEANWIPGRVKKMLQASHAARRRELMSVPAGDRRPGLRPPNRTDRENA